MVRTFLSEGGWGDVAGGVRPGSGTSVMLSQEETREVLVSLRGGGGGSSIRSGRGNIQKVKGRM